MNYTFTCTELPTCVTLEGCHHVMELIRMIALDNGLQVRKEIHLPFAVDAPRLEAEASRIPMEDRETFANGEVAEAALIQDAAGAHYLSDFLDSAFDGEFRKYVFVGD